MIGHLGFDGSNGRREYGVKRDKIWVRALSGI